MKALVIQFTDGNTFAVPVTVMAEKRADYFASVDGYEKGSADWQEEYENGLNNSAELKASCFHIKWSDIEPYAKIIKSPDCSYEDEWKEEYKNIEDVDID